MQLAAILCVIAALLAQLIGRIVQKLTSRQTTFSTMHLAFGLCISVNPDEFWWLCVVKNELASGSKGRKAQTEQPVSKGNALVSCMPSERVLVSAKFSPQV